MATTIAQRWVNRERDRWVRRQCSVGWLVARGPQVSFFSPSSVRVPYRVPKSLTPLPPPPPPPLLAGLRLQGGRGERVHQILKPGQVKPACFYAVVLSRGNRVCGRRELREAGSLGVSDKTVKKKTVAVAPNGSIFAPFFLLMFPFRN